MLKHVSDSTDRFVTRLDDYKLLLTKARLNLINRGDKKCDYNEVQEESPDKKADVQFSISLDHATGATKFHQQEIQSDKGDKPISVDELVSLTPSSRLKRSSSVSVNTSIRNREENDLKRTPTISNPGSVGRRHPALPKFNTKDLSRRTRGFPSKSEIAEMRKKNPTMIKNAVYSAVILEEFMKELAAISIEQTLQ